MSARESTHTEPCNASNPDVIDAEETGPESLTLSDADDVQGGGTTSTVTYDQEPFETFQHKVSQLCHDIGWGEPSQITRLKGGSYNRIFGLKYPLRLPQDYILRVPRDGKDEEVAEGSVAILDQVAVLRYTAQFLPTAFVAAFDSTGTNALGLPYVLQTRVIGTVAQEVYYKLPLAEKLQITSSAADLILKMEDIKFESPGRLAAETKLSSSQNTRRSYSAKVEIAGFRASKYLTGGKCVEVESQSLVSLLKGLFKHQELEYAKNEERWMEWNLIELAKIAGQMENAGLMRTNDKECVLWHWDFAARNIMIKRNTFADPKPQKQFSQSAEISVGGKTADDHKHSISITMDGHSNQTCEHQVKVTFTDSDGAIYHHELEVNNKSSIQQEHKSSEGEGDTGEAAQWDITGILDWDNVMSVPLVLTRQPPQWLWCNEDTRSTGWTGDFDKTPSRDLSQDELLIKARFDQIMSKASPTYMEDTYHRGVWLRRLARFALDGFSGYGALERLDLLKDEWKEYYGSLSGLPKCEDDDASEVDDSEDEDIESNDGSEDVGGDVDMGAEDRPKKLEGSEIVSKVDST